MNLFIYIALRFLVKRLRILHRIINNVDKCLLHPFDASLDNLFVAQFNYNGKECGLILLDRQPYRSRPIGTL